MTKGRRPSHLERLSKVDDPVDANEEGGVAAGDHGELSAPIDRALMAQPPRAILQVHQLRKAAKGDRTLRVKDSTGPGTSNAHQWHDV